MKMNPHLLAEEIRSFLKPGILLTRTKQSYYLSSGDSIKGAWILIHLNYSADAKEAFWLPVRILPEDHLKGRLQSGHWREIRNEDTVESLLIEFMNSYGETLFQNPLSCLLLGLEHDQQKEKPRGR